jgi:hypothetical protein
VIAANGNQSGSSGGIGAGELSKQTAEATAESQSLSGG